MPSLRIAAAPAQNSLSHYLIHVAQFTDRVLRNFALITHYGDGAV